MIKTDAYSLRINLLPPCTWFNVGPIVLSYVGPFLCFRTLQEQVCARIVQHVPVYSCSALHYHSMDENIMSTCYVIVSHCFIKNKMAETKSAINM